MYVLKHSSLGYLGHQNTSTVFAFAERKYVDRVLRQLKYRDYNAQLSHVLPHDYIVHPHAKHGNGTLKAPLLKHELSIEIVDPNEFVEFGHIHDVKTCLIEELIQDPKSANIHMKGVIVGITHKPDIHDQIELLQYYFDRQ